jgi:hypothetical protein
MKVLGFLKTQYKDNNFEFSNINKEISVIVSEQLKINEYIKFSSFIFRFNK